MSVLTACRICQADTLESIVDFGEMAQGGLFPKIGTEAPKLPLHLVRCLSCGLVQLGHVIDPALLYGNHYGYRSGLNLSMVQHLQDIVTKEIPQWVTLKRGDGVLDIGSNDGTLLNHYSPSMQRFGVDPSARALQHFYQPGIGLCNGFFGHTHAGLTAPFKVVTSIAMFYDLPDPVIFAQEVRKILHDDGVWILEQGYWPDLMRMGAYDVICHEHVEYYSLWDMSHIMERAGLVIRAVSFNGVNGASMRVIISKGGEPCSYLHDLIRAESVYPIDAFVDQVIQHGPQLKALLTDLKAQGSTIQGYGASTKGSTVLQHAGIGPDLLDCILDVSEAKAGCWTPGTHIPIVMDAPLPDYYLVGPWHYRDSILRRESAYLAQGGSFIFPLPSIEIVSATGVVSITRS